MVGPVAQAYTVEESQLVTVQFEVSRYHYNEHNQRRASTC